MILLRLNDDLVRSILLRLPVKSIGQCQVVCKSWYKIINEQFFVDSHLGILYNHETKAGAQEGDYILVHEAPPPTVESGVPPKRNHFSYHNQAFTNTTSLDFPYQKDRGNLTLVGCCCGLVCLFDSQNIYFWNPALRKTRIIPEKPGFGLRTRLSEYFGYTFVPQLKDFKLVRILSFRTPGKRRFYRQVNVFTFSTNAWRRLRTEELPCDYLDSRSSQATVNGVVHWPALGTRGDLAILAFDMIEEVFHKISPPPKDDSELTLYSSLSTYRGCLCINWTTHNWCDIWVMKDYSVENSWSRMHRFIDKIHNPLKITADDHVLVKTKGQRLAIYDLKFRQPNMDLQVSGKHLVTDLDYDNMLVQISTYTQGLALFNAKYY